MLLHLQLLTAYLEHADRCGVSRRPATAWLLCSWLDAPDTHERLHMSTQISRSICSCAQVISFAGELLSNAEGLLRDGLHTSEVADGFTKAADKVGSCGYGCKSQTAARGSGTGGQLAREVLCRCGENVCMTPDEHRRASGECKQSPGGAAIAAPQCVALRTSDGNAVRAE